MVAPPVTSPNVSCRESEPFSGTNRIAGRTRIANQHQGVADLSPNLHQQSALIFSGDRKLALIDFKEVNVDILTAGKLIAGTAIKHKTV